MADQQNDLQQTVAASVDGTAEVPAERAALVKEICDNITEAKTHWQARFDKMKWCQRIARGKQWVKDDGTVGSGKEYVANITLRHINQRVAAIYAKNPRAVAKRRPRLDFKVWDGQPESLRQAQDVMQRAATAGMPQVTQGPNGQPVVAPPAMPPSQMEVQAAQAIMQDIERSRSRRAMLDKLAKTLQIIFHYSLDEPIPKFKLQAKQLVRRVLTCGVGYVRIGYQKLLNQSPELDAKIKDASDQLAEIERLAGEVAEGMDAKSPADKEKLRLMVQSLQSQAEMVVREGLIFDFPKPWQIIIDPCCTQLKGFVGASWVAHEFIYTPAQVKKIWKKDLGKDYKGYTPEGTKGDKRKKGQQTLACVWVYYDLESRMEYVVWVYYDLESRMEYVVCDGHKDFLKEPGKPDVETEQFHPFFTLSFNDVEDDEEIYPPSDVELIHPMQDEYNRSREGWRQHRIANRPAWVGAKGAFGENAKETLANHDSHELLEVPLKSGQKIADILEAKPVQRVDAELYGVEPVFSDVLRVSGDQEANLGGTGDGTATEATIAENTRVSSIQSAVDDVDEMFTEIARASGQILLMNMSAQTARAIAGEGAVWPEFSRKEIADEVLLEIKAGSSGRPNRALRIANLERLAPRIEQVPGLNPTWWLKQLVTEVDDTIEIEEALMDGMPSIVSLNNMQQPAPAGGGADPKAQGARGGMNAPQPSQPQTSASFPAGGQPGGGQQPKQTV